MAKRSANTESDAGEPARDGRVNLQIRMDAELHGMLKQVAENAQVNLNQLINGILWATAPKARVGEAYKNENGFVSANDRPKCLFFGRVGYYLDPEQRGELMMDGIQPAKNDDGELWFRLDFTGRGVVQ